MCESTSPNWTPAFGKIAAAVCDGGGMLSHAAIVGREYGVPTVTAVGVATLAIGDGDEIEVDGTNGKVTILKRAAAAGRAHDGVCCDAGSTRSRRRRRSRSAGLEDGQARRAAPGRRQVPQGFAVTVDAYRRHCARVGPRRAHRRGAGRASIRTTPMARLRRGSAQLFARHTDGGRARRGDRRGLRGAVPALRGRQRPDRGALLGHRRGRRRRVFAGIFDTYLGVSGLERVLDAGPGLLGLAVHRARARLPAAQGDQPPRHAHRRRRDRADPRPRLRGGVLGAPGHRQARPDRHRDDRGVGARRSCRASSTPTTSRSASPTGGC